MFPPSVNIVTGYVRFMNETGIVLSPLRPHISEVQIIGYPIENWNLMLGIQSLVPFGSVASSHDRVMKCWFAKKKMGS